MFVLFMYLLVILFILFEVFKMSTKKEHVFRSHNDRNGSIIFGMIVIIFGLIMILLSLDEIIDGFNKAYDVLIPDYYDHWYEMLNRNNTNEIANMVYDKGMEDEYFDLIIFNYELAGFLNWFQFLIGGIFTLVTGLNIRFDVIYEDGVKIKSKLYKWEKLDSYKWSDSIIGDGKRYYELIFILEKKRLFKKNKEVRIQIKSFDKDNVDVFLRDKLANYHIA